MFHCLTCDVVVYCSMAGISRAVTMTMMYVMTVSSLGCDDSLRVVKHCRPIASPNYGFIQQLHAYEKEKLSVVCSRLCRVYWFVRVCWLHMSIALCACVLVCLVCHLHVRLPADTSTVYLVSPEPTFHNQSL